MECVRVNSKGKIAIPKNIVRPRGDVAFKLKLSLGCTLIFLSILFVSRTDVFEKVLFIGFHAICLLLVLVVLEIGRRCCLFFEEINHLHTKYNGNLSKLVWNYVFEFKPRVYIAFLIGLLCSTLINVKTDVRLSVVEDYDLYALILMLSGVLILKENLKLQSGKLYDSLNIKEMNGLDYGSSMAHSYFHGYLKIVLPPDGYTSDNLKDLMVKYESVNNIVFQMYKLYILVPLSLHCPNSLKTDSSPSILDSKTLESIRRNRAGVKYRDYKNAVYKILYPGEEEPIYLSAEYATPLLTFKEAISHDSEHARHYREHQSEIIWNFYNTTMDLLNADPNCKHLCELIFYDDQDGNGGYIDVGKMLVKKISKERKLMELRNMH